MPTVSRTVLIVGGGIAGLSAAYGLAESATSRDSPIQCTLVEAEPRLGGKILTEQVGGFVIEGGPDSFLSQKPWGVELCRRLGLADRVIGTNRDRRKTYVYSKGRLEELPEGLVLGVPTKLGPFLKSGLLSWRGKLRLGAELLIPRRSARGDESLGAFFRRLKARLGAPKAITATAHKLARLIYRMLRFGTEYVDRGQDYYEQRYQSRVVAHLMRRAQQLGYQLIKNENFSVATSSPA